MRSFDTLNDLVACVGEEVALSDWVTVTQEQVNRFADATGDHQWIHVDVERARAGPFGAPIAHGFLTLSLIPVFFDSAFEIRQSGMGVNYGLNKVRFTAPVPVGSRLRARMTLMAATPIEHLGRFGRARRGGQTGVCGRGAGAQLPLNLPGRAEPI
jgi:acyl dehydratase